MTLGKWAGRVCVFRDPFFLHAHIADIEGMSMLVDFCRRYYDSNYRISSAVLLFTPGKLQKRAATGTRCSIANPFGVEDLAETPQSDFESTHAAAMVGVQASAK